jgi:hypothetical protein
MKTYIKKAGVGEIEIYLHVLNPIAAKYNHALSSLVLPTALSINIEEQTLELPFYDGQTFNELWNKSTGGSLLGLDLSSEAARVLNDLAIIDITAILSNEALKKIPKLIYDQETHVYELGATLKKFNDSGVLNRAEADQAIELLKRPYASPRIFNNGDFYPRNFIRTPEQKIVLIDWETWNAHSPFYIVDHVENVAAVCFVHMWNNRIWQEKYVDELRSFFPLRKADFQKAILIKSLELAKFWFRPGGQNELCENQIAIFRNALNDEYMMNLMP